MRPVTRPMGQPRLPKPLQLLLALSVALTALGHATTPTAAQGPTQASQLGPALQQLLDNQRKQINIPGVSATIIFPDGSRWSGASGKANRATNTNVTTKTPFVVGSITKTFVAALIVQLAEEGTLSLDDRLSRWLPAYPGANKYTLRQLLSHTSGVYNYFEHPDYGPLVFGRPTYKWNPDEILSTFRRAAYFAPGTNYRYSNTGYVLLGRVAETATGIPLATQLKSRFSQPLGLTATTFQGAAAPPATTARGYLKTATGFKEVTDKKTNFRPTRSAATVAWAAGDGVSTADDIASWFDALYGGQVLAPGSLADVLDHGRYAGNGRYGLGVMSRSLDGRQLFGHTGSLRGYVASAWHLPDEGLTVAVLTNRGRIKPNKIANALIRRALADYVPPPPPPPPPPPDEEPLPYSMPGVLATGNRVYRV